MRLEILSLRVSRRAIGAAILKPDGLALSDGRHIPSVPTRAVAAVARGLDRWMKPSVTAVIVDAPKRGVSQTTDNVLDTIAEKVAAIGLHPIIIGRGDILAAYGVKALRTRTEVRDVVATYWPDLVTIKGRVKNYVIDAAAASLFAEIQVTLSPQPT